MPLTNITEYMFSDLVVRNDDAFDAYNRDVIPVKSTTAKTLPLGAVVFRAKGSDPTVDFAPVTAAANLDVANEYAVIFGDEYNFAPSVALAAGVSRKCVGFIRAEVQLKEWLIKAYTDSLSTPFTTAQFESLKHLLKQQGVIVEKTCMPVQ